MQPLNPFLGAFSKSTFASQCIPARDYILLVPLTAVLLASRDTESGAPLADSVSSDEFLGSHILRIGNGKTSADGGKNGSAQNLREARGKPRVYNTINGRCILIKDNLIYSNKGMSMHLVDGSLPC